MNAGEDSDIKLQRASGDLIAEFQKSLPKFLWKTSKELSPRLNVRVTVVERLTKLLGPFQEWPQLLDPYLSRIVSALVDAFLSYLVLYKDRYWDHTHQDGPASIPLPRAISILLYTLCKVRGVKIISRFFNNEPKYLEPMLDAFMTWDARSKASGDSVAATTSPLTWEERYIMLSWLSLLLLAPFDLASISSVVNDFAEEETYLNNSDQIPNVPPQLPSIALHILKICGHYVFVPGKEREAAQTLLLRLSLRPDMLRQGLLDCLLQWVVGLLKNPSGTLLTQSTYAYTGALSFLAGVSSSAEKKVISPYLAQIFEIVNYINNSEDDNSIAIKSSALDRKLIIKIERALNLLQLKPDPQTGAISASEPSLELENTIDHLLTSLGDKDTPVRFASSKALSVITVSLDESLSTEVIDAVIDSMSEGILWENLTTGIISINAEVSPSQKHVLKQNLSQVDPLRWQGLTLTLAQLLFRRSPFPYQLPQILSALVPALGFEQRSATGTSIGTNVRDAACFGIWALSRKYTTKELLAVPLKSLVKLNGDYDGKDSILQALAVELVVTACLDPAGNIRRGSSAALQELIGRHPDTIVCGISLVQAVDYHAVSLRSKAMIDVALNAAKLSQTYWRGLVDGLLGWRGCGSPDAESRRWTAEIVGALAVVNMPASLEHVYNRVKDLLIIVSHKEVELRHGLLLSLCRIVDQVRLVEMKAGSATSLSQQSSLKLDFFKLWEHFQDDTFVSEKDVNTHLRRELSAEAICMLIRSLSQASMSVGSTSALLPFPPPAALVKVTHILSAALVRTEDFVVSAVSGAVDANFAILDMQTRKKLCADWISHLYSNLDQPSAGLQAHFGHISVLGVIYKYFAADQYNVKSQPEAEQNKIIDALVRAAKPGVDIESRVASVKSIAAGVLDLGVITPNIVDIIETSLNDYTIDQRGDIGSLVRLQALDAVRVAWDRNILGSAGVRERLICPVVRLAAEKLDKVRFRAWVCLEKIWQTSSAFPELSQKFLYLNQASTVEYFMQLLQLLHVEPFRVGLLVGYVTTAGVGAESTLHASRLALIRHFDFTKGNNTDELLYLWNGMLAVLKNNRANDRILTPALEVTAFLCDSDLLRPLEGSSFKFRNLLSLIQKSHYKSTNVAKLEAAVKTYVGLTEIRATRADALAKLSSMLLHPFPKVRNAVADSLSLIFEEQTLRDVNWSMPTTTFKDKVDELKKIMVA